MRNSCIMSCSRGGASTRTYTLMATLSAREPQPRLRHAALGVGLEHFVWGGNGYSKINPTRMETFRLSSAKWEDSQSLRGSLPECLCGMTVTNDGDSVYSFGGRSGSTLINSVYEINPRTLQCKENRPVSSYSPPGVECSGIVCFDELLVAYGGYTDRGRSDDLYVFDLRKSE